MTDMWIGGPEARSADARVATEANRVRAHIQALTTRDLLACRVCGSRDGLTEEHAPSAKAGNVMRLVRETVDDAATRKSGEVIWKAQLLQGGARGATLCGRCNNATGRWYNPAYIRLVDQCRAFALPENAGKVCDIALDLHPQRAAKQALTHLVATSAPGITTRYPAVRELLLNAEIAKPLPVPLSLWLYLRSNSGGRSTGIASQINITTGIGRVFAEFSFWPLGWLLAFDDQPVDGAANVSSWLEIGYHEQRQMVCAVPCQWALTPSPGDFRSPEAIVIEHARRLRSSRMAPEEHE